MTGEQQGLLHGLEARIPRTGPAWLGGLRERAAASLRTRGLPTRKDEAWRFTSLRNVIERVAPAVATEHPPQWIDDWRGDDATWAIVIAGGVPRVGAAAPPGVDAALIRDAAGELRELVQAHLGTLARVEHFTALNLALFEHGLVIRVREGASVDRPLHIVYGAAGSGVVYPRVLVLAAPGSAFTLIESFVTRDATLTSAVTEIVVGAGARVDHVRAHHGAARGHLLGTLAVRQDQGSRLASRVVTLGGALTRLDLDVVLAGEGAECRLHGAYHAGRGEEVDHHTTIEHAAPGCTSHEVYRGIVDGTGHAVFDGTIVVRRDAQKTSAHQENRNLLLSDDAVVNTKPHLQIDADDVSCSHGATVGSLDDREIFYLRTRGIDEERARALLTFAFVRELVEDIPHAPLTRRLTLYMLARLPHGDMLEDTLA